MPDIEIKPGIFITRQQQLELRRQWVAALRSGEFRQTSGALECRKRIIFRRKGNCYLGVLCRVFDRMFPGLLDIDESSKSRVIFDSSGAVLPELVQRALGLSDDRGSYDDGCLTAMNDCGVPFPKIADFIESNPPGLWVDEQQAALAPHTEKKGGKIA